MKSTLLTMLLAVHLSDTDPNETVRKIASNANTFDPHGSLEVIKNHPR